MKKRPAGLGVKDYVIIDAAETTMKLEDANGEVTVLLTDDAKLRELNRQYLGVDAPTDVLSFPSGDADPETGKTYLGDVVISVPRAKAQAAASGHKLEAEVQLLVIHGVLHLLGYDHAEPRGKSAMWRAQDRALNDLGLAGITIHA
ncbi:MAG TPA: rRNA maturation RNase YbeY [Anaerolineales bacterium]|nr:rRNA maturation RNase YbeY [Anaerolineales bacterium]